MCFHGPVCNPVEKSCTARRKATGDRHGSVETNVDRTHTQKRLPLRAKRYFHLTHSYFLQLIPAIVCASMCGVFRLTLWTLTHHHCQSGYLSTRERRFSTDREHGPVRAHRVYRERSMRKPRSSSWYDGTLL